MKQANEVTVTIQRVGGVEVDVTVPADTTVADTLNIAGITLEATEQVFYCGAEVNINTSQVEDGDSIQIVQNKKGGTK